jgi:hypothetical protein
MLGQDCGIDNEDEAIAACGSEWAPVGCEVFDTHTGKWIGPTCMEEIEDARARLLLSRDSESGS